MIDLFPNTTVVFQWFIFMTALVVLNFGLFKPIFKILEERRSRTLGEREKALHYEQKVAELLAACEKKLDEARLLGETKKEEAHLSAEKFTEGLMKKTRQEVNRLINDTHSRLEQESREAGMQLRQYAQQISRDIAAEVLERPLS